MNAIVGQKVHFTNASDPKGKQVQDIVWAFGDGYADLTNWDTSHIYDTAGTYIVSLSIETECGTCSIYTDTIDVTDEGDDVAGIDPRWLMAAAVVVGALIITEG